MVSKVFNEGDLVRVKTIDPRDLLSEEEIEEQEAEESGVRPILEAENKRYLDLINLIGKVTYIEKEAFSEPKYGVELYETGNLGSSTLYFFASELELVFEI